MVGLGPAGPLWLTPEARGALAAADDLVGYGPYLDRVPVRPGQQRHGSDNKVEAERAEFALELARRGSRVAVVSAGDPGVFAMATAVLEVASQPSRTRTCRSGSLPGVTAAQAAAARVGRAARPRLLRPSRCPTGSSRGRSSPSACAPAAAADLVLALYNPGSRSRTCAGRQARDLLLEHRAPDTPVVVARDVGGPAERVRIVRARPTWTRPRSTCAPSCSIGSSQTRTVRRGDGEEVVWTPRRYPA